MCQVEVSVICNVYNHESYIAECLENIVKQKTDFTFEVLVHDDASTDNSASIIREYERNYPELIKPIYQTENQYSKGGIAKFQYPRVKGRYIAFCEGDDYWTDPLKLQKQYDAMEAHPEVDICAHSAKRILAATGEQKRNIAPRSENCIIPAEEVIAGGGDFVATNSLFYRTELRRNPPQFKAEFPIDYTMQIQGSLRGGMLYIADFMSVYRSMVPGSWNDRYRKSREIQHKNYDKLQKMLNQLNEYTEYKYDKTVRDRILLNEWNYTKLWEQYPALYARKFREIRHALPMKQRISLFVKLICPWLPKLIRKLKSR